MLRSMAIPASVAVSLVVAPSLSPAAEVWSLAAREGGCFPISTLERKLPDLPAVRDPQGFADYVQGKGWAFTQKPHVLGAGRAVEFTVPSQGLALMFVTIDLCIAGPGPGR